MNAYLVVTHSGFWGRGTTPSTAAAQAIKSGASRTDSATVKIFLGAAPKDVSFDGLYFEYPSGITTDAFRIRNIGALLLPEK